MARVEGGEQPGTWVTVLTGDMGNTFLVLFSPAAAVVGPVGLWGTRQGSPQVHGPGALACADDRRHAPQRTCAFRKPRPAGR